MTNTIKRNLGFIGIMVFLALVLMLTFSPIVFAASDDADDIKYTTSRNERIEVLSNMQILVSRKSTSIYWILCIDGYKFVSITQNSGSDIVQFLNSDGKPMQCNNRTDKH